MSPTELTKVRDVLARALSVEAVNQLGRDTGQAVRLRTVTPHRLFLAVVSALASGHVASLADLLRAFNYHNGVHVAYKAFYNRLARIGFTLFMRGMCARLIERLRLQTLTPAGHTAVARFTDIVIHDGSSFAVKPTLRGTFPGRFTTLGPAAVEVHATYSGCADEIRAVQIAPDREAERPFLPDPATLTGCLLLADRGYPSVPYFEAVQAARRGIPRAAHAQLRPLGPHGVGGRTSQHGAPRDTAVAVSRHAGHAHGGPRRGIRPGGPSRRVPCRRGAGP